MKAGVNLDTRCKPGIGALDPEMLARIEAVEAKRSEAVEFSTLNPQSARWSTSTAHVAQLERRYKVFKSSSVSPVNKNNRKGPGKGKGKFSKGKEKSKEKSKGKYKMEERKVQRKRQ